MPHVCSFTLAKVAGRVSAALYVTVMIENNGAIFKAYFVSPANVKKKAHFTKKALPLPIVKSKTAI